MALRVVKVTPGRIVNGRFVAAKKNPEKRRARGSGPRKSASVKCFGGAKKKQVQAAKKAEGLLMKRNPLPTGKFVRVHAIRKNKNGTIDVVMSKKKNPKKRAAKKLRANKPTTKRRRRRATASRTRR